MAELANESYLSFQHVLELWIQRQRASWSLNPTSMGHFGPDNCIEQAPYLPHHGERLAAHACLVFGTQTGCCTLAMLSHLCKSWQHAAGLMQDKAQVLQAGRLWQQMLPNTPRARSCAVEDQNLCLVGADGEAEGLAKAVRATRGRPRLQHNTISVHQGGDSSS